MTITYLMPSLAEQVVDLGAAVADPVELAEVDVSLLAGPGLVDSGRPSRSRRRCRRWASGGSGRSRGFGGVDGRGELHPSPLGGVGVEVHALRRGVDDLNPLGPRGANDRGHLFAIAPQRSSAPRHQCRSHRSQMTIAASATGTSLISATSSQAPLPLNVSTRVRSSEAERPLGAGALCQRRRAACGPRHGGRPRRGRWRAIAGRSRSRSRPASRARYRRRGPRDARASRRPGPSPRAKSRPATGERLQPRAKSCTGSHATRAA